MTEHRLYAGSAIVGVSPGDELSLEREAAHRVTQVLRMRPGERLSLFGAGRELVGELTGTARGVTVRLLDELSPEPERPRLTLYQALIRPNRFEWLIEKATEVGVAAIVPLLTEHTAVRAAEIGAARLSRWERIAIEAAEQCGRRTVPEIARPAAYQVALGEAQGDLLFAWEGLRMSTYPPSPLRREGRGNAQISLFVGPEGGWNEDEVERSRMAGATFLSLGPTTLRSETAAIIASALLLLDGAGG